MVLAYGARLARDTKKKPVIYPKQERLKTSPFVSISPLEQSNHAALGDSPFKPISAP